MTTEMLTSLLAKQIMGWHEAPGRFLVGQRRWRPRWRFQPMQKLEAAFELLEQARPQEYTMGSDQTGIFWARVRIGESIGEARDRSKPRAIAYAVARAIGISVDPTE